MDDASIIDDAAEPALAKKLIELEMATTDQVIIVSRTSLDGEFIEEYARDLGNQLGVGRAGTNNGVLILIAPNERRVRIAVGDGVNGLLTDQIAKEIIDEEMIPEFVRGDFTAGVEAAVDEIDHILRSDLRRPYPVQHLDRDAA